MLVPFLLTEGKQSIFLKCHMGLHFLRPLEPISLSEYTGGDKKCIHTICVFIFSYWYTLSITILIVLSFLKIRIRFLALSV